MFVVEYIAPFSRKRLPTRSWISVACYMRRFHLYAVGTAVQKGYKRCICRALLALFDFHTFGFDVWGHIKEATQNGQYLVARTAGDWADRIIHKSSYAYIQTLNMMFGTCSQCFRIRSGAHDENYGGNEKVGCYLFAIADKPYATVICHEEMKAHEASGQSHMTIGAKQRAPRLLFLKTIC